MAIMTRAPHERREHPSRIMPETKNVGGWERGVRLFFGTAAAGAAFAVGAVWLQALLGLIGAAGLLTSLEGYCPINRAFGRDSYHHRPELR